MMVEIAIASLKARRFPVLLVMLSLVASLALLMTVERVKVATQNGFNQSISGVDLIIGPRSGGIELVLYTVFHLGKPVNNITTETLNDLQSRDDIDWLVPVSLGDSHRGHRVIATTRDYFSYLKYGDNYSLAFKTGRSFQDLTDVVLGAGAADELGYTIGTSLFVAHGSGESLGKIHDDFAFKVVGILEPTGTPIDHALFMSLESYELIHLGWQSGTRTFSLKNIDLKSLPSNLLRPKTITAAYVGLNSPLGIFQFQRDILNFPAEAISAVIPSLALAELWSLLDIVEQAFKILGWLVVFISLISITTMALASLDARNREMTIYRALGASPWFLVRLIILESTLVSICAVIISLFSVNMIMLVSQTLIRETFGIMPDFRWLSLREAILVSIVLCGTVLISIFPAISVYSRSLNRGFM